MGGMTEKPPYVVGHLKVRSISSYLQWQDGGANTAFSRSIPRETTGREQGGHVGAPNNRRWLVFYC